MTWTSFWIGFLVVSLLSYAVVALVVAIRGGGELLQLIHRSRGSDDEVSGAQVGGPEDTERG